MAYTLEAIIGRRAMLDRHRDQYRNVRVVLLQQGFAMVPLTDELFDELAIGSQGQSPDPFAEFWKLSARVATWVQQISLDDAVAYLEADYFGGVGSQAAAVWHHGQVLFGPMVTRDAPYAERSTGDRAINRALRHLGVSSAGSVDEFEAVGLPKHRHTPDWLQAGP